MKYSIGEIVKIKATGEKVKIHDFMSIYGFKDGVMVKKEDGDFLIYLESELKPYRPSRTGKYRNEKGQFVSGYGFGEKQLKRKLQKDINEALLRWNMKMNPDSKQTNYQKILTKLDVIEKKIDELGRKV